MYRALVWHRTGHASLCLWYVKNDTRAHGPCWSPVYSTRLVDTGVIFDTPVDTPELQSVNAVLKESESLQLEAFVKHVPGVKDRGGDG